MRNHFVEDIGRSNIRRDDSTTGLHDKTASVAAIREPPLPNPMPAHGVDGATPVAARAPNSPSEGSSLICFRQQDRERGRICSEGGQEMERPVSSKRQHRPTN